MKHQGKITLLLFCASVCMTAALLHWSGRTQEELAHLPPAELFQVVEHQLTDIRSSNLPSAYSHSSSAFRQNWSLEQFISMTHGDYRKVLGAERVEYGPWHQEGRKATLQVFFVHTDGTVLPCIYTLVKERSHWKIDRAQWLRGWPTGQRLKGIRS